VLHRLLSEDFTVFMAVPTIYGNLASYIKQKKSPEFESIIKDRLSKYRLMVSGSAALPET
jgi:acyl-CoA synthetase (AMP-forming)/AMP-acid ligase II